ncbi:MAG: excinuclease ABC subunit C, partial [Nitrospinae bacterium]|nr:excinuclease ABC subunit C [Nitrospinota bacterium]
MTNILEKLDTIPSVSGVYLMKDIKGDVLYIGKARSLNPRVRSYFHDQRGLSSRIQQMVLRIADIDCITTATEVEALILENNLIKKHKPKYNVMLRDDKEYPYLRLSTDEEFPILSIVRRVKKDKARYFGPYVHVKKARETLRLIYKIFPLRQSKDKIDGSHKRRPCLNYQMGRCLAPCAGYVTKEEYWKIVREVILFLKGRNDDLLRYLKERMKVASDNMRYEEAARIRDQISAV